MSRKIFIINNFKDAEIKRVSDIRALAKKSGAVISDYLYRYDKATVIDLLTSDDHQKSFELNLFIRGIFEDIDGCDLLYWIHGDEIFDQLNRMLVARFIASRLRESVKVGDIYKIINNFVITDQPIDDSEYEFIQACIIFSQYYLNWVDSGGVSTDKNHPFNSGKTPFMHFGELAAAEFNNLNGLFNDSFEEFNIALNPESHKDNLPTIRLDNVVYYGGRFDHIVDAWLSILAINYFETSITIYVLSISDQSKLVKLLCSTFVRLNKDETGFSIAEESSENKSLDTSNPENQ